MGNIAVFFISCNVVLTLFLLTRVSKFLKLTHEAEDLIKANEEQRRIILAKCEEIEKARLYCNDAVGWFETRIKRAVEIESNFNERLTTLEGEQDG